MARIRTIKPEFWTDEEIASLSEPAMLMAIGLLNYSDDEGWFNANPLLIKAAIFPLREPSKNILGMLKELSGIGYIELFQGAENKQYGKVCNFSKHQRVDKPRASEIKGLILIQEQSKNPPRPLPAGMEGNGMEEEGNGSGGELTLIPDPVAFITLTLNDNSEHPIFDNQIAEWQALFPAVDVRQELRNMRAWCLGNPKQRKTKSGILRFVTSWLAKEQNRGGTNAKTKQPGQHLTPVQRVEAAFAARKQ